MAVNPEVMDAADRDGEARERLDNVVRRDLPRRDGLLHRSITWDVLVAVKLLTFALIIAIRPFNITHDCGLLLHAAEQLVDGRLPYVDFLEQNPPLIYYLFSVPVAIAQAIDANPIPVYLVMFWLLVVASTLATRRLLGRASDVLSPLQRGAILLAVVVASECTLLAPDFGQREHWFAIAIVPMLVLRWLVYRGDSGDASTRPPSWGFRVALGFATGVGVALKHHFVLIWLGIELACVLRTRKWRALFAPETVSAAAFLVMFLLHFLFIPAAMRDGFFVRWVPFVMANYWVYDHAVDWPHIVFVGAVTIVYGGAAIAAWGFSRPARRSVSLAMIFALFTMLALASFVLQQKDYSYHLIPVYFGALPCMANLACAMAERPNRRIARLATLGIIGVVAGTVPAAGAELALSWTLGRGRDEPTPIWREILSRSDTGDTALFISTNVGDGYPELVRYGYRPGSRYLVSMPIALVHSDLRAAGNGELYHDASNRPEDEMRYLRELSEDIRRRSPRVIVVVDQADCQGCAPGFNVNEFLKRAGVIDGAMGSYEDVGVFDGKLSRLRLFVRP